MPASAKKGVSLWVDQAIVDGNLGKSLLKSNLKGKCMNLAKERTKYIIAVILYGTIGVFLRQVSVPSEIVVICRGIIGSAFIFVFMKAQKSS